MKHLWQLAGATTITDGYVCRGCRTRLVVPMDADPHSFNGEDCPTMSSIYAVVRETIRNNAGLTKAQIAAKTGSEQVATDPMVDQLVTEGLVAKTGDDPTATYTVTSKET